LLLCNNKINFELSKIKHFFLVKRYFTVFGIICIFLLSSFYAGPDKKYSVKTVVIDPGHGGKDPGCIGYSKSKEKDVVLSIALKLGEYIKNNFPDMKVIYTRKDDRFIEVYKRADIANDNKADLFISIHCNACRSSIAHGAETWVMGINKNEANLSVAKRENAAVLMEEDYTAKYSGFDPNSPEANIIFTLYQNAFLEQGLNIASKVQKQLTGTLGIFDRGVKQAGFLVLYRTTMPSILIETGFLSNKNEEKFLTSEKNQQDVALSIYKAFEQYKTEIEGIKKEDIEKQFVAKKNIEKTDNKEKTNKKEVKINKSDNKKLNNNNKKNDFDENRVSFRVQFKTFPKKRPLDSDVFKDLKKVKVYFDNGLYKYTTGDENTLELATKLQYKVRKSGFKDAFVVVFFNDKRIGIKEAFKKQKLKSEDKNYKEEIVKNDDKEISVNKTEDKANVLENKKNISFRVQFKTLNKKENLDSDVFKDLKKVKVYFDNGLYKYTTGNENTLDAATKLQYKVRKSGFKDAFVVALFNDKRISIKKALDLLKNK
jgi:N-acetylmuramoyl-L-alanine amidase